jgi:hypothetical protein
MAICTSRPQLVKAWAYRHSGFGAAVVDHMQLILLVAHSMLALVFQDVRMSGMSVLQDILTSMFRGVLQVFVDARRSPGIYDAGACHVLCVLASRQ